MALTFSYNCSKEVSHFIRPAISNSLDILHLVVCFVNDCSVLSKWKGQHRGRPPFGNKVLGQANETRRQSEC